MKPGYASAPLLFVVLTLSACMDTHNRVVGAVPRDASTSALAPPGEIGQDLARALAAGLGDPGARARLRSAMRRSRTMEHKLVLQDFVETADGAYFIAAAARGSGVAEPGLRAWIAALPPLDFYLPVREHRLS